MAVLECLGNSIGDTQTHKAAVLECLGNGVNTTLHTYTHTSTAVLECLGNSVDTHTLT